MEENKKHIYDRDYFIKKYESIPEDKWCKRLFIDSENRCCARGHCGARYREYDEKEEDALLKLFANNGLCVTIVNDSEGHPKDNILNALKSFPA